MELWIPVVVVLDIVIVAVLVFLILRFRQLSMGNGSVELEAELGRLKQLASSFEAKEREVKEALEKIKANQTRLDDIINKLEEAIEVLHQTHHTEDDREEVYQQARDMLRKGVSEEEVMKRLGISRSEVALLLTVEKMRKN